jgi:hypothetical protein
MARCANQGQATGQIIAADDRTSTLDTKTAEGRRINGIGRQQFLP